MILLAYCQEMRGMVFPENKINNYEGVTNLEKI